ncbi:sodium/potassium-transporting ATPase subunit alpha [Sporothrix schenckii 1099-18]|uniref:Sodium/potassium-transporting ATPase subunit alpha n=1 Tax=Sporothrix schenckii 1099-18 TaxID=1397361 RepID=A0A0F2M4Z3_SPOSC|nr:sodium/potassium-transporting ATPase subunit alpha [Sporothrix schenckii 1099-18]KJR83256.1 sodium/potassium-transporting ATPase subunit alpha [Sporothrix schenckii 1099-18]
MVVENTLVWQKADDEEKGGVRASRHDRFALEKGEGGDENDDGSPSSSSGGARMRNRSARQRSRSSRRSIDPSAALPIQYRTLSQDIDDAERQRKGEQTKAKDAMVSKFEAIDWHKISSAELEKRLDTSIVAGLSANTAKDRLRTHGANAISPLPNPWFGKVVGYFFKGFGSILAVGGILVFLSWKPLGEPAPAVANLALGIVLIAVFLLQAAFNGWQDWSSSRVMQSITAMLPASCHVLRENGIQTEIAAADLVPGDVLLLTAGDRIPADVRYVRVSHDMTVDRAVLTGESKPIKASASEGRTAAASDNYLETNCIGLQGTHCVTGTARAVVVATGDSTVFGQIAKLTSTPKTGLTTMEREILRFVLLIFVIMVTWIVVLVAVWAGWLRKAHPDWISVPMLIVSAVSVAIAYIPEGLPIATTASLTITANLMKKHRILCKSLKTVETLGAVSVICSDKTGTLTKNKMYVTDCSLGVTTYTTDEVVLLAEGAPASAFPSPLNQLCAGAGLCNTAEFDTAAEDEDDVEANGPKKERRIFGNATDQAALRLADRLGHIAELRAAWSTVADLAFDSKTKYMATALALNDTSNNNSIAHQCLTHGEVVDSTFGKINPSAPALPLPAVQQNTLLFLKGAPDMLLDKCTRIVQAGVGEGGSSVVALTPTTRAAVQQTKDAWSAEGRRVILVARKILAPGVLVNGAAAKNDERLKSEVHAGAFTLIGLLALMDPPRDEIHDVMQTLRGAGIRSVMVTGDFGLTALAIARQCGMVSTRAVHGMADLVRSPSKSVGKNVGASSEKADAAPSAAPSAARKWAAKLHVAHADAAPMDHPLPPAPPQTTALLLTGADLLKVSDYQWDQICSATHYPEIVFARTTPDQKLRIVRAFQARGAVVAMTGDGVNDAPALKAADVGIALAGGSDIAVEAADMVLLGGSTFASVVEAVRYGRLVFDNMKKIIAYLLPAGSWSEFWPVFTNVILGLPQILSSFLMIIIW